MEKNDAPDSTQEKTDVEPASGNIPIQQPPVGPSPPPNGGVQAWFQVLGSFMLYFNTWGIMNAYGVYQQYYETGQLFSTTSSNISWVGSIEAFLLLLVGVFAGPIYDRGHLRALLFFGSFMVVFGHMMLSLCHTFWQVVLAQGFVIGIGTGCLFVPCVAIVPQYFSTRLGLGLGIAVSGSALGGVLLPIVLYRLIDEVGFGWAVRVLGFISLATLLFPLTILRLRVKPPKVRAIVDLSAFRDSYYMFFVLTSLVGYMGIYVIFFYLAYYAQQQAITSASLATYLVPIFNAGSLFGRAAPNALADKVGPFNLLAPAAMASGILMLCMMAVRSEAAIIVVALLSGFMSGSLIGLPPMCFVALTADKSKLGTRIGQGYAMMGLGVLASGPCAGAILGTGGSLNWHGLWTFGGVCTLVSGVGYLAIRVVKFGPKINQKA